MYRFSMMCLAAYCLLASCVPGPGIRFAKTRTFGKVMVTVKSKQCIPDTLATQIEESTKIQLARKGARFDVPGQPRLEVVAEVRDGGVHLILNPSARVLTCGFGDDSRIQEAALMALGEAIPKFVDYENKHAK